MKAVRAHGWRFLTRLRHNRLVNPDGQGNVPLATLDIPAGGRQVHRKGFGFMAVFRTVAPNGDAEYWATNDVQLHATERATLATQCWAMETYHRGLKQCCGVERAQVRKAHAQQQHILLSVRAFVRLEVHRFHTGTSWYATKIDIIRAAIRTYLANPVVRLRATA